MIFALVHFLHAVAGVVWFGGALFMALAVWPALLSRPPAESKALFTALALPTKRVMATAGSLTPLLGIVRGTWLGPIQSVQSLMTPYGATFLVAFFATVALSIHGSRISASLLEKVWAADGSLRAEARSEVRQSNLIALGLFVVVLVCMFLMKLGL